MFKPMVADIYHGDVVVDLKATAAAGIKGIIHKATQGTRIVDRTYGERREIARKHGLLWGAYHFANDEDVDAQVEHFLKVASPDDDTLLALDFEPNRNNTMSLDQAREFMQAIFEKTGRRPILYSGNLIKEELGRTFDPFFAMHRLWLAQYGPRAKLPPTWKKYWLWQYTGDGIGPLPHAIAGIRGQVDLNIYAGTPEQLAAEWVEGPPMAVASAAEATLPGNDPLPEAADEPVEPPVVVTTRPIRPSPASTRAPRGGGAVADAGSSKFARFAFAALRVIAILGFMACSLGGAALGFWAARTWTDGFAPEWGGAAGLVAGFIVAILAFGALLLLVDIAENGRRSRAILERELH